MASTPLDNGGGDGVDLRQSLSQLLDDACQFLCKSTAISKQFQDDTIEHKLLVKQEQARQQCKAVVERLESQLPGLQRKLEADVTEAIVKKERQLRQEYDLILDAMKQVVKDCNIIESMLEEANPDQLAADAPQLISHLRKTMAYNPEDNFKSVLSLEYVPDFQKISSCFRDTSQFGYIKTSLFEIGEVKLVNCQNNAYKDNEDILCLKISQHHIKMCKEFIRAFIMTPQGTELPVSSEDNQDGTMTLKYTPEEKGVHYLHVLMYNSHISGSPFRIDVMEMKAPHLEQSAITPEAKKKQVSRSFLCELTRHITEQPPPKQYRCKSSSEVEKPRPDRNASPFRERDERNKGDGDLRSARDMERPNRFRNHVPSRSDVKSWRDRDDEGHGRTDKKLDQNNNENKEMWDIEEETKGATDKSWNQNGDRRPWQRNGQAFEDKKDEFSSSKQGIQHTAWPGPRQSSQDQAKNVNGELSEEINHFESSKGGSRTDVSTSTLLKKEREETSYSSSALRFEPSIDAVPEVEIARGESEPKTARLPIPSTLPMKLSQKEGKIMNTKFLLSPTAMARRASVNESLEESEFGSQASDDVHYAPLAVVEPETSSQSLEANMADLNLYGTASEASANPKRDTFQNASIPIKSDPESGFESSTIDSNVFEVSPDQVKKEPIKEIAASTDTLSESHTELHCSIPMKKEGAGGPSRWSPLTVRMDRMSPPPEVMLQGSPATTQALGPTPQACSIDELSTYPPLWLSTDKQCDILAKYIGKGDIVEGLNTHPHVQVIGGPRCSEIKFPIGITVNQLTNDIIVCNQGADTVKVFQWNGQPKLTLGGGKDGIKFFRPSAVVTDSEGVIYVKDNKIIASFDKDGNHIHSFGKDVLNVPYGLSLTPCGRLLTLNPKRRVIMLFERDGSTHTEHPFEPCFKNDRSSKLRFLAVHGDKLVVCDLGLSVFYLTSISGGPYEELGSWGRGYGEFNEPSGVTMDKHGNMLIADSKNDRIHVYDAVGNFSGFVNLSDRIRRPSDIHLTQDGGHLLVSNLLGHSISIFRLVA